MSVSGSVSRLLHLRRGEFGRTVATLSGSYLCGYLLQAVYFVLLARVLGPFEYGVFAGSLALVSILATLSGAGAGNYMVQVSSTRAERFAVSYGTAIAYVLTTLLPLIAIGLAISAIVSPTTLMVVLVLALSELVFFRGIDIAYQALQAHDSLTSIARFNVALSAARLVTVALYGHVLSDGRGGSLNWAIIYGLTNVAFATWVHLAVIRKFGRPQLTRDSYTATFRKSYPFALGMASRILYMDADKYILSAVTTGSAAGVYAAGSRVVSMAFSPVQAMVYSSNTRLFRAADRSASLLWASMRRLLLVAVPVTLVLMLGLFASAPLLPMILGPEYSLLPDVVRILSPLIVLQSLHYILGDGLMAAGHQLGRSLVQLSVGLGSVWVNAIVIPKNGWFGAAVVALVSATLLCLLSGLLWADLTLRGKQTKREEDNEGACDGSSWIHREPSDRAPVVRGRGSNRN